MDQSCQKVLLVLKHLGIGTYPFSTLPISFLHQGVNLDSFTPEPDCFLLTIVKNDIHNGVEILIGEKLQKRF